MSKAIMPGGLFVSNGKLVNAAGKEVSTEQLSELSAEDMKRLPEKLRPRKKSAGDLPEDFPGRAELEAAGLTTRAAVKAKNREELVAVKGIGEKTADSIAAALK